MRKSLLMRFFRLALMMLSAFAVGYSQSNDQSYPTPITTNQIEGSIKARDVGDPRLTTYFYTFNGSQGDIFVNVVSKNFNGDIDVFIADGLRPLSKIVIYADSAESETGRVIYLRKPEKLILRVEGRTPNDDPAAFTIKFAGSFIAAVDKGEQEPELPEIKTGNDSGVRVNSVGTIIERIPKPKPTPKPAEEASASADKEAEKPGEDAAEKKDENRADEESAKAKTEPKKVEVVVSENIPEGKAEPAKPKALPVARTRTRRRPPVKKEPVAKKGSEETTKSDEPAAENKTEEPKPEPPKPAPKRTTARTARATPPPKEKQPDPLENIRLVILFKDGTKIERPMSEIVRFTVDRGILTVISKDGTIGRYSILDIAKTTIE